MKSKLSIVVLDFFTQRLHERMGNGLQEFPAPASDTKHLAEIYYPFPSLGSTFKLKQSNTSGSTGSSLWLSSQILACHLLSQFSSKSKSSSSLPRTGGSPLRVLELGSGIGLVSLLLARLDCHVIATDIEPVLSGVLRPNVDANQYELSKNQCSGSIKVAELDWLTFNDDQMESLYQENDGQDSQEFDLILTADTIYHPNLVSPLFKVIFMILTKQVRNQQKTDVLLGLERRDDKQINSAFAVGQGLGLEFKRITDRKVRKSVDSYVDSFDFEKGKKESKGWKREDWEGVELYEIKLATKREEVGSGTL